MAKWKSPIVVEFTTESKARDLMKRRISESELHQMISYKFAFLRIASSAGLDESDFTPCQIANAVIERLRRCSAQ